MWQHCWVVEAANVWIAQLRNLQECRCCPVRFAGLSVPSALFVRFQVIMAKLPPCRMWRHAVWQLGTKVSEEPAASNLYCSTQMLICLWSVNGYRRTQRLYCKSLGLNVVMPYSCHQAHHHRNTQRTPFMYFCDDGPDDGCTVENVAWCCLKNELFHQPTLMHKFLYSLTICLLHYYPRHVSSINMPIFRRKNCIHTASGISALLIQTRNKKNGK